MLEEKNDSGSVELKGFQEQQKHEDAASSAVARPVWKQRLSALFTRQTLVIVLLGQILSLCITATTIFSTKLAQEHGVSIPTSQSFLNYLVLGIVYTSITLYKEGFQGWLVILRRRSLYYILFALIDVEGNYFMVKAYAFTSLLSAMLLDTWTIPCVVLLSVFFLKMRFIRWHYLGVFTCLVGMGILIWSDMAAGKNFPGSDYLKGDLFCLAGATCYALSNVGQEYLVRQKPMYEVVGQLGFWATIINGIQLAILEREELKNITWTGPVIGYIIGFDIAMFLLYSVSPILLRLSSATFFNLSLLTSDFYGLIFGLILFSAKMQDLYPVSYVLTILGIIFYNIYPAPEPKFKRRLEDGDDQPEAQPGDV
ncbi:MAG: solute carrier family 35 member SLC35F1/F2/F6 [Benniella sp.]|nr:MAG: solute carrier family 35 member SLC35F1/F2/F6 [Benniella sp.]